MRMYKLGVAYNPTAPHNIEDFEKIKRAMKGAGKNGISFYTLVGIVPRLRPVKGGVDFIKYLIEKRAIVGIVKPIN